jgi:hypothetical protein
VWGAKRGGGWRGSLLRIGGGCVGFGFGFGFGAVAGNENRIRNDTEGGGTDDFREVH